MRTLRYNYFLDPFEAHRSRMSRSRSSALLARIVSLSLASAFCIAHADSPVGENARALHERVLVLDTHLDTPLHLTRPGWDIASRHDYDSDLSQVDYPRMVEGGLDGGFWVIYTAQGPRTDEGLHAARDTALLTATRIREMVARHPDRFELATRADDAERIAKAGKRVVYLSMENGYPIGKDLSLLDTFYKLGVRMFGPVHFANNDLADSATDPNGPEWQGLSPLGKQVVVEANRLGIVLDASHASDDVLDQLIELSRTPIILSHSGCKAIANHPRNVDDERLRKLAAKGGVIQMNSMYVITAPKNSEHEKAVAELRARYGRTSTLPPDKLMQLAREQRALDEKFGVPRATFDDFLRHLMHALEVVGPDHVGIGADWDGGGGVEGMNDIAALPRITEALLKAGYSEADVQKIWGGNLLRVLRAAEDYSRSVNQVSASTN